MGPDSSRSKKTVNVTPRPPGKPERKHWLIMISLSFISFVVSLDATILVTALPVSCGVRLASSSKCR